MPEPSTLDARLAEIDRRLRTIQSGLAPSAGAAGTPGAGRGSAGGASFPPSVPPPMPAPNAPEFTAARLPAAAAAEEAPERSTLPPPTTSAGTPRATGAPDGTSAGTPRATGAPNGTFAGAGATEGPDGTFAPPADTADLSEAARLVAHLREITAAHERLLSSSRELLTAFTGAMARQQRPAPAPPPAAAPPAVAGADAAVTVAAGPFPDTGALRRFERSLEALPEVREVAVREYTGGDRVVVDVHLMGPTS